jgi:hypothetical protein
MIDTKKDKNLTVDGSCNTNLDFYVRKMYYQGSLMINICDEELLGKNIVSESLNINITNDFFNELTNEKDICNLLKNAR